MQHTKYTIALVVSVLILCLSGCKSDDSQEMTPEQWQVIKLARPWEAADEQFVKLDNVDVSQFFEGFTLMFNTQKNYTTTNGNSPIWPESGTYEFAVVNGSTNIDRLIRNDGTEINILELTENSLKIEFDYSSTPSGGRTMGISGGYYFELVAP